MAVELFWNSGEREKIQGLDILGLRQVDQELERRWVAGVTTISFRARYLSLLPWAIGEFYERQLAASGGRAVFDEAKLLQMLARLEFVVLASTQMGQAWGESGNTFGTLGKDVHADILAKLSDGGTVDAPGQSVGSYGTYVMPCRSFGLLDTGGSGLPVRITPRGRSLRAVRGKLCAGSRLAEVIATGGTLEVATLNDEGRLFSANGLVSCAPERDILEEAFRVPFVDREDVRHGYRRFLDTTRWAFGELGREPRSSEELIQLAYARAVQGGSTPSEVEVAWAEYEFRRAVHFALELLLSALTDTLMDLAEGTVAEVVANWDTREPLAEAVRALIPFDVMPMAARVRAVDAALADEVLVAHPPNARVGRELPAAQRALYALAVLLSSARRTAELRRAGHVPDRGERDALERAFSVLTEQADRSVSGVMVSLLQHAVVERHLATTLREMSQGQKCSLRFYPEGEVLRPTGTPVRAGYSGDRLGNVLGMWADLGELERRPGGRYALTDRGHQLLAELRQ